MSAARPAAAAAGANTGLDVEVSDYVVPTLGFTYFFTDNIAVEGDWSINLDAKKVFFETDADINNGALKSNVTLDPWVISAGVTRRF